MIKQKIVILFILLLLVPNVAFASTVEYGYFGTTTETSVLWADSTDKDDEWISLQVQGEGNLVWIGLGGIELETKPSPGTYYAPDGSKGFKLVSTNGGEIYAVAGNTTNPNNTTVTFTPGETGGEPPGGTCEACEMFDCPGWDEYMGQLQAIKNAIPPAPNWNEVAGTFRDTITPQIKADLQEVFGSTPEPPTAPNSPGIAPLPSDIDDRGITAPTGQEAPGLDDSTFSSGDIKNEALPIQERTDPTGGFDIIDPIGSLPTQDEFMQNLPNEGTAPTPAPPTEGENIAPTPGDTTGTAPIPAQGGITAPTPGGTVINPPTPGSPTGTAPIPNESGTAPLPGYSPNNPPLPGGTAP